MYFHLLSRVSHNLVEANSRLSYHLEGVELLLDLLSKHRGEPVAGRNLTTSVVFSAGPCIVKDEPRGEGGVPPRSALGCAGSALGILAKSESGHEVVLIA